MKGYIHSVDSFSAVDGEGIRMAVFFQGCPLDCWYCHNPDSKIIYINKINVLKNNETLTKENNILKQIAVQNQLSEDINSYNIVEKTSKKDVQDKVYQNNAIKQIAEQNFFNEKNEKNLLILEQENKLLLSVEEIVAKFEKNKRYYKNGGVTIIGGEPLLQEDFLIELLLALKEKNIHTIIDTSLAVACKNLPIIAQLVDKMIVDIKFYNENDYKKYCKASLKLVLSNLEKIDGKCEIELRTVIAPNINDTKNDILEYAGLTKKYNCKHTLVAFHNMGQYKYEKLNINYKMSGVKNFDNDLLQEYQLILDTKRKE